MANTVRHIACEMTSLASSPLVGERVRISCGTETKSEEFGGRRMATRNLKLSPTSVEDFSNRCAEQYGGLAHFSAFSTIG